MTSIQSSNRPLVFPVNEAPTSAFAAPPGDVAAVRTIARALEGMQKEAVVADAAGSTVWRMVSDEGPYLNGTDLAPFPLAFFTAGLAAGYLSQIRAALARHGVAVRRLNLIQDNRYTMTGSALRGTMTGGALPVDVDVQIDADGDASSLAPLIVAAIEAAPATALLQSKLDSEFTLAVNHRQTSTQRVAQAGHPPVAAPENFDALSPPPEARFAADIIRKLQAAEVVRGVEGGAGSSLAAEQNRTLHVRGAASVREDGLLEVRTQLLKPIGSVFRFLAEDGARSGAPERAPSALAYLSAGIAFCYMTQLGRYAHIVKKPLDDYRLVQDTWFSRAGEPAAKPVRTHVFLRTGEGDDYGRALVDMGEQTCFLHAACRTVVARNVRVNGVAASSA